MVAQVPLTPQRALSSCAVVGGIGLAITLMYKTVGVGLICPLLLMTGIQCPFCGGTRMAASLLDGNVSAAWSYNPLLLLAGVALGVRILGWMVEWMRKPAGAPADVWTPAWVRRHWAWIATVVGIGYVVLRAVW